MKHWLLVKKEIRSILRARPLWLLLLVITLLTGYGFIQAVRLYSEASRTALESPGMTVGMSPLDGVLVPVFGAYYLVLTLLSPFLAIRSLGAEKQSGSVKLLLQLPLTRAAVFAGKITALLGVWFLLLSPGLAGLLVWRHVGGHLYWPETINLLAGYTLYAWALIGISLFSASVSSSVSTAAIIAVGFAAGSWVLDFASGMEGSLLNSLSFLSLTPALKSFERGLFIAERAAQLFLTGLVFTGLAAIWIKPERFVKKIRAALLLLAAAAAIGLLFHRAHFSADVSEDRRNSFSPADEAALRGIRESVKITLHLSPEDSRLMDMERNILGKLRRSLPRLEIVYAGDKARVLKPSGGDDYGVIEYEVAGRKDQSTSNSDEEILPIIFGLAGKTVRAVPSPEYAGYPLVADVENWKFLFYVFFPLAFGLAAWWFRYHRI